MSDKHLAPSPPMLLAFLIIGICVGVFIGFALGIVSSRQVSRYYTVSGYITDGITKEPLENIHLTLYFGNAPIVVLYTDSKGFYSYSFLGVEGLTLKIVVAERFVQPVWVEIGLTTRSYVRQNFEVYG